MSCIGNEDRGELRPGGSRGGRGYRPISRWLGTFLRYGLVSALGAPVQYGLLALGVVVLGAPPGLSAGVGALATAGVNYLLNYQFAYRSSKAHAESGPKFLMSTAVGVACASVVVEVGVRLGWSVLVAQLAASTLAFLLCFFLYAWCFESTSGLAALVFRRRTLVRTA